MRKATENVSVMERARLHTFVGQPHDGTVGSLKYTRCDLSIHVCEVCVCVCVCVCVRVHVYMCECVRASVLFLSDVVVLAVLQWTSSIGMVSSKPTIIVGLQGYGECTSVEVSGVRVIKSCLLRSHAATADDGLGNELGSNCSPIGRIDLRVRQWIGRNGAVDLKH